MNPTDDQELRYTTGHVAIETRVRGVNHWTGDRIDGEVTRLMRSGMDGRVYVETRRADGTTGYAVLDDVTPERSRCRRPRTIASPRNTGGVPQGSGYRCANCGHTIWFIRDGSAEGGERMTHDAWLSEQPSRAF